MSHSRMYGLGCGEEGAGARLRSLARFLSAVWASLLPLFNVSTCS